MKLHTPTINTRETNYFSFTLIKKLKTSVGDGRDCYRSAVLRERDLISFLFHDVLLFAKCVKMMRMLSSETEIWFRDFEVSLLARPYRHI